MDAKALGSWDTPVKLARRLVGDVVDTLDGAAACKVLLEHLVVHVEGQVPEVNAERPATLCGERGRDAAEGIPARRLLRVPCCVLCGVQVS